LALDGRVGVPSLWCAGDFPGGRIWVGNKSMPAGQAGEFAAEGLTETLNQLGFGSRFETDTSTGR